MQTSNHAHRSKSSEKAADVLSKRLDEILLNWEQKVQISLKSAHNFSQPILIHTIPLFLNLLAEALSPDNQRTFATEKNTVAQEHGKERAQTTQYNPDQIAHEYRLLKETVENTLSQVIELTSEETAIIQRSFDSAIQEAMASYFTVHIQNRNQLIAMISHDLRNPLSVIRMSLEILLSDLSSKNPLRNQQQMTTFTSKALLNVKRVDRMIQNLLDSRLLQFGERLHLSLRETDVYEIAEEIIQDCRYENLQIQLLGKSCKGNWDTDFLTRALENLVSNAIKYGDNARPISVLIQRHLGRTQISVQNFGTAIPTEHQHLIYQAFQRLDGAKASGKPGWGIGLAQAKGAAEAHGGCLTLKSSEENGTTFTIDIPDDSSLFQEETFDNSALH